VTFSKIVSSALSNMVCLSSPKCQSEQIGGGNYSFSAASEAEWRVFFPISKMLRPDNTFEGQPALSRAAWLILSSTVSLPVTKSVWSCTEREISYP